MSLDLDISWSYMGLVPSLGNDSSRVKTPIPPRGAPHPSSFPSSEGIDVKHDLNPPDPEVVRNALSSLIESTKTANQGYLSNPDSDPAFDRDAKGRLSELIKVACQALIREADIESCDQRLQHDVEAAEYRRQRDNQLADMRYRQNALLPIHRFPVELFSNVLIFVVLSLHIQTNFRNIEPKLRQLANVARHWKYVILSTPQVWSYIHEAMSTTFVRLSLQRSKMVPLDVVFYKDSYYYGASQLYPFTEIILPHSHRWRSLEVPYLPSQILEKLELHAPALQHLQIVRTPAKVVQLGPGMHLQTLDLKGVSVPWDSSRISQLCKLSLTDIQGQHAPSLSQIAHILACSPRLESLALARLEPLNTPEDDQISIRNINLSNLRSLEIYELPWEAYNRFIGCFQFPFVACKNLQLLPKWSADLELTDIFDHLATEFVQQVNYFAQDASASISFSTQTVALRVDRPSKGGFKLRMAVKQGVGQKAIDAYSDVATTLAQLISAALPDAPLTLHTSGNTHPGFSVELLGRFSSTTEISLGRDSGCDIRSVVQFLGQQYSNQLTGGEGLAWPCPRLKKLDLCELPGHPVGDIRAWVKERWVKWKEPTNATIDGAPEAAVKPDGLLEVMMPMKRSGKTEMWRPVQKTRNKKRPLRPKARIVCDDGEEDQEDN